MTRTRATAVVLRDDKILMMKRVRDGELYFVLPGGGVEEGETGEAAVIRELAEETTLRAELSGTWGGFVDGRGDRHDIFLCDCPTGEPVFAEDAPERLDATAENTFEPVWMPIAEIAAATIYPLGTKELLLAKLAEIGR